jgi:hypothetical protein
MNLQFSIERNAVVPQEPKPDPYHLSQRRWIKNGGDGFKNNTKIFEDYLGGLIRI